MKETDFLKLKMPEYSERADIQIVNDNMQKINDFSKTASVDIEKTKSRVNNIEGFIGYNDPTIFGVEWDVPNRTVIRLSSSTTLNAGSDFDNLAPWKRRRCILHDNGTVLAYRGESGYTETGKLTQAVTIAGTTYPVGTTCQVMVEQPLFYYRSVPIALKTIQGQRGYSVNKIRYYVSEFPHVGFKPHPQFVRGGKVLTRIYKSAYEACAFNVTTGNYYLNDEQTVNFTATTGDKLSSIANAKPMSGLSQVGATRAGFRQIAKNRGAGWGQQDFISVCGTQLLYLIEYANFNSQAVIGQGVVNFPFGAGNEAVNTGATSMLGNNTGMATGANGLVSISYRGEENFWGNIGGWEEAINIQNVASNDIGYVYFNQPDYRITNPSDGTVDEYINVGFQISSTNGYASAIGWSEVCDFAFIATETAGATTIPLCDYFYQSSAFNWYGSILGGSWYNGTNAGAFYRNVSNVTFDRDRFIGGRALFIPTA